jgi:hypothetical protein
MGIGGNRWHVATTNCESGNTEIADIKTILVCVQVRGNSRIYTFTNFRKERIMKNLDSEQERLDANQDEIDKIQARIDNARKLNNFYRGHKMYKWVAVMDDQTCGVCAENNGRKLTEQDAAKLMDEIAKSIHDIDIPENRCRCVLREIT